MRHIRNFLKDNRGFSLVELIVAMLLMVAVSGMIYMFMNMSTTSFQLISKQTTLQTEAQTATDFITEKLQGAENCGLSGDFSSGAHTGKCIWIKQIDGSYGFILFDKDSRALRYKEYSGSDIYYSGLGIIDYSQTLPDLFDDDYALLATCVNDMSLSTTSVAGSTGVLASVKLSFKLLSVDPDKDAYETTFKVVNRNAFN